MAYIFVLVVLQTLAAAALSRLCERRRERWSNRRIIYIAALPLPLMIFGLCAYLFAISAMGSKQDCGVDACGMAMGAAMVGSVGALLLYLLGIGVSALTLRGRDEQLQDQVSDIFL